MAESEIKSEDAEAATRPKGDLARLTRQLVEESVSWNSAAIRLAEAANTGTQAVIAESLIPDNVLFPQPSPARLMSTEEWNALAVAASPPGAA